MTQKMAAAVTLLREAHEGALATLENDVPFVSGMAFVYEESGVPEGIGKICLIMSDLARHTKNIMKNPNVSLFVVENGPAPIYEKKRMSLQGKISYVKDERRHAALKALYLQALPGSEKLFSFLDFHLFEIDITGIHAVDGFGGPLS